MQQQGIYLIYVDMLRETGLLFCWTWCYKQKVHTSEFENM